MRNKEQILFAYWCARQTTLRFHEFRAALDDLQKGVKLQERNFTEKWGTQFPWIYLKLLTEYEPGLDNISRWSKAGIDMVTPNDPRYPRSLLKIEDPPTLLYGRGNWECLRELSLAIVGSREPSGLSLSWIESEVGKFLVSDPCVVISGGARGVDLAAHRIAIRKKCPTVVLFPSGLEQMYPGTWSQQGESWAKAVLKSDGLLLSEYPPSKPMNRGHFHERNRLISGLSSATLLIEARRRSGTMVTAQTALAQSRPLFVVPAHPFDGNARGGLDLLTEGADLIRDAEDLSFFFRSETKSWKEQLTTNWLDEKMAH